MLKLEYFYYMKEVCQTGSINRAAENLYISQPYLSQTLKKMEQQLGVSLLKRSSKGISPTDAGKEFLNISKEIIKLTQQAEALHNKYECDSQELNISSMPSFTMMNLFQRFLAERSSSKFVGNLIEMPNGQVPDEVSRGNCNIGLHYVTSSQYEASIQKFRFMGMVFTPLVDEPLYAVLNTRSPLAKQEKLCLQQLQGMNFLAEFIKIPGKKKPIENNPLPSIFFRQQGGPVFNNNRSMLFYLTMSENSYCVGQKSLNLCNPFVEMGQLVYVPLTDINTRFITGYLTSELQNSSPQEEQFLSMLEEYFDHYCKHMSMWEKAQSL